MEHFYNILNVLFSIISIVLAYLSLKSQSTNTEYRLNINNVHHQEINISNNYSLNNNLNLSDINIKNSSYKKLLSIRIYSAMYFLVIFIIFIFVSPTKIINLVVLEEILNSTLILFTIIAVFIFIFRQIKYKYQTIQITLTNNLDIISFVFNLFVSFSYNATLNGNGLTYILQKISVIIISISYPLLFGIFLISNLFNYPKISNVHLLETKINLIIFRIFFYFFVPIMFLFLSISNLLIR